MINPSVNHQTRQGRLQGRRVRIHCEECGTVILKSLKELKGCKHHFCCKPCFSKWRKGQKGAKWSEEAKERFWTGERRAVWSERMIKQHQEGRLNTLEHLAKNHSPKAVAIRREKMIKWWQEHPEERVALGVKSREAIGEKGYNWQGGKNAEPYGPDWNEWLREAVRVRDGYKCQKCGLPEMLNGKKLPVHHIDYDKRNCRFENLITLCDGCNSKVNTQRKYWTRFFLRKLHKKGIQQKSVQLNLRFIGKVLRGHKRHYITAPFGWKRSWLNESELLPVQEEQDVIRVIKILRNHCFFYYEIAEMLNGWSWYFLSGNRSKPVNWNRGNVKSVLMCSNGYTENLRTAFHLKSIPVGLLIEFPSDDGNNVRKARRSIQFSLNSMREE